MTSVWYVAMSDGRSEEIVVAWSVGSDPFQAAHGLAVWQPFPDRPAWRAVYAFLDPVRRGVFVIRVQQGDLTGDGVTDLLSFEDTDGSGACGVWRVLATEPGAMSELYRRHTCDTQIDVADGTLRVATSVYDAGDAHCCPSATRRTTLKWDGAEWTIVDRELVRND